MSSYLDKVMLKMSIGEVEEPYNLPDLPEYSSLEENRMSLVGRILNPDCQSVSDVVLDMPMIWSLKDKVRGFAVSIERFQFVFKEEADLDRILNMGAHSYKEWSLVLERWVEIPSMDFLQYIPVWVRLKKIPGNHRTLSAIKDLAGFAGEILELAFDPLRSQSRDFVRVKVKFDVARPVRRSKVVNLPCGGSTLVLYDFERIQKRCYTCQRLTHELEKCPIYLEEKGLSKVVSKSGEGDKDRLKEVVLKEGDPLYGVLKEEQVGNDHMTGRPRINEEVLKGMRLYLVTTMDHEKLVREERVKASAVELAKVNEVQGPRSKSVSRNYMPLSFEKGKRVVMELVGDKEGREDKEREFRGERIMGDAIRSGRVNSMGPLLDVWHSEGGEWSPNNDGLSLGDDHNEGSKGGSEASSSGSRIMKNSFQRRSIVARKKVKKQSPSKGSNKEDKNKGRQVGKGNKRSLLERGEIVVADVKKKGIIGIKRKTESEVCDSDGDTHKHKKMVLGDGDGQVQATSCSIKEVVPNEGPSGI